MRFWIVGIIGLIITVFVSYHIGLFILRYSVALAILLIVIIILLLIMLHYPKTFIYLMIIFYTLLPVIMPYTSVALRGSQYLSITLGGILNIVGFIMGILFLFSRKAQIFQYRLTVPIILFLGVLMIGVFISPLKLLAVRDWLNYAMPAVFYLLILENINDLREVNRLLKFSLFFFIPSMIVGIWQSIFGTPQVAEEIGELGKGIADTARYLNRIEGLGGSNKFGTQLVYFLLLTVFFFFEMSHKLIYSTLFLIMLFLLFNTYSRSAWAGFVLAFSMVGALRYQKFYLVFLILIVCFLLLVSPVTERLMFRLQEDASVTARYELAKLGWEFFKEAPILGHGLGSFRVLSGMTTSRKKALQYDVIGGLGGSAAHNEYIRIIVEGGIITLIIYLVLIYKALKLSVQILRLADTTAKNYGAFLIAVIAAILLMGYPGVDFANISFYFWTFIAFGEIYYRNLHLKPQSI